EVDGRVVARQDEAVRRLVRRIKGIVLLHPKDTVERNALVRIEQMINRKGSFRHVPMKGLVFEILAFVQLVVIVRVPASRDAKTNIRVRAQQVAETQFRIQVHWRNGET